MGRLVPVAAAPLLLLTLLTGGCSDDDVGPECDPGYAPVDGVCLDIDECLQDNGGCGDPARVSCVNQVGTAPACQDIDECQQDNGGCGDPGAWSCVNLHAAAPQCVFDCAADYHTLTSGVSQMVFGQALPSALVLHRYTACPIGLGGAERTHTAAARLRQGTVDGVWTADTAAPTDGKLLVIGHEGPLGSPLDDGAAGTLLRNAVDWMLTDRDPTTATIAVTQDQQSLGDRLAAEGYNVQLIPDAELIDAASRVDVIITTTYPERTAETYDAVTAFLEAGGGLIAGGQAWWWSYDHQDAALNYPGNRLIRGSGITISTALSATGTHTIWADPPSPLYHALVALDWLLAHVLGDADLNLTEQRVGVDTASLAIATLPLGFDYYDGARAFLDAQDPVVPTEAAPLHPANEPIKHLVVRFAHKFADELPPAEVEAHPAAQDFPGPVPADAERVTETVVVDGSYVGRDGRYLYSNAGSPVWRSTGLYAPPGELITVTVDATSPGLAISVGCHSDTLWRNDTWSRFPDLVRTDPLLETGTTMASAFGGPIYLRVTGGTDHGPLTVTIAGAVRAPWYVHGETTLDHWQTTARNHPAPWAELASDSFVITVPSADIRDLDRPDELMTFWEEILDSAADLAAIDQTRVRPERFVLDRQISAGWMHSGYPLMAHTTAVDEFVDLAGLRATVAWGPFHELGHNHQGVDWTLPGTTESTVNLWSVYLAEAVVGIDRSLAHTALGTNDRAQRIQTYLAGGANFATDWNVWTALETYLQLQEGFGWQFLMDVIAEYNALPEAERPTTDAQRIDQWVLRTSLAAGTDLGPFYLAWGFPISPAVLTQISSLPPWPADPMAQP